MRVAVIGAGAIGSLIGAKLAAAGNDVTLVGRDALVEAVGARGLLVEDGEGCLCVRNVRAVTAIEHRSPDDAGFDLIIITVKAHDTREAVTGVAALARRGTPVLLLQNGVGGEEIAREVLGSCTMLSGVITLAVAVVEPGRVRVTTAGGGIGLADHGVGACLDSSAELLRRAGFRVRTYRDYRAVKWSKLLLNIVANASPAILDMDPGEVFACEELARLELTAFREAATVMRALGVTPVALPGYPVPVMVWALTRLPARLLRPLFGRLVAGGRGGKMPSLHMDLSRGRNRSEVEYLNGAVVKAAGDLGIRVPANDALYSVLSRVVTGEASWEEYRGQPAALLAEVDGRAS